MFHKSIPSVSVVVIDLDVVVTVYTDDTTEIILIVSVVVVARAVDAVDAVYSKDVVGTSAVSVFFSKILTARILAISIRAIPKALTEMNFFLQILPRLK